MRVIPWLIALMAACTTGIDSPGSGGGPPDAAKTTGSGSNRDSGVVWTDAAPGVDAGSNGCIDPVPANLAGDGHHNPGQDCMNSCHNHGFTLAGTVFTAINNNTAAVGATVRIMDANSNVTDIVTRQNGNFFISTAVAFPVTVLATSCPTVQHMTGTVTAGGCNKTGCHTANNQIHLP